MLVGGLEKTEQGSEQGVQVYMCMCVCGGYSFREGLIRRCFHKDEEEVTDVWRVASVEALMGAGQVGSREKEAREQGGAGPGQEGGKSGPTRKTFPAGRDS